MGALQASEFAASVQDGDINLEAALTWHFRSNHYPPLPLSLIPVAIRIIKGQTKGKTVKLPRGISWRGHTSAPVSECIKAWHLDHFIQE